MSAPPLPPRPPINDTDGLQPPPLPPLPRDLRLQTERYNTPSIYELESPAHFEKPLIAPRPHKPDRSIPASMARSLDDQAQIGYGPAPASAPAWAAQWNQPPPSDDDVARAIAALSMTSIPQSSIQYTSPPPPPAQATSSVASSTSAIPSLTAPLPVIAQLQEAAQHVVNPGHDPALKVAWCRDVFLLVDRATGALAATDPPVGPLNLADPTLDRLAHTAIPVVLQLAASHPSDKGKMPPHVAEAVAMRATFAASGAFPDLIRHNPRAAFRDFEAAARGGYSAAWFRLGRDYENFNDHVHAKECFERGAKQNVESCLYRLGMAHLLGQLSLPANPVTALPLLQRAALLASLSCPQPAYVYALLLLAEFTQITVPPSLLVPLISAGSSPSLEARKHLERAAYLHFGAAQYKLGHAYEFAEPPFVFDPLLSVQYYSLASQQGEVEADMALSKWFLCGSGGAAAAPAGGPAGGGFEKDEALALTFAEKAARKGLPSAEFAMGYYAEVGVGQPRDLSKAMEWYQRAKAHGNADAISRIAALSQPAPQPLARAEHDSITEIKLVRRRTLAAQRAETQPLSPPWEGRTFPTHRELAEHQAALPLSPSQSQLQSQYQPFQVQVPPQHRRPSGGAPPQAQYQSTDPRIDVIRKNSLAQAHAAASGLPIGSGPPPLGYTGAGAGPARLPGLREQSPQRGRSQGQVSASTSGTASPQRNGSPRHASPGRVVGGRPPSPGRRAHHANTIGSSGSGGMGADNSSTGLTTLTRLERMRLNLDGAPPLPVSTSHSQGAPGLHAPMKTYSLSDPPVSSLPTAGGPLATPRPVQSSGSGAGVGATPIPNMHAAGGGRKPQTFADMGIHGVKADDKECIIM